MPFCYALQYFVSDIRKFVSISLNICLSYPVFNLQTDIQHAQFTTHGSVSRLTYIAKTDLDYGTMTCLASNEVGESNKPCVFQIVRDGEQRQKNHVDFFNDVTHI
jgi:hypothetical protein